MRIVGHHDQISAYRLKGNAYETRELLQEMMKASCVESDAEVKRRWSGKYETRLMKMIN